VVVKLLVFSALELDGGTMPIGTGRVVQRERAGTSPGVEPIPCCPHVYKCTLSVGCLLMHFWPTYGYRHIRLKLYLEQVFWGTLVCVFTAPSGVHLNRAPCYRPRLLSSVFLPFIIQ